LAAGPARRDATPIARCCVRTVEGRAPRRPEQTSPSFPVRSQEREPHTGPDLAVSVPQVLRPVRFAAVELPTHPRLIALDGQQVLDLDFILQAWSLTPDNYAPPR
jgi:hypothetical protein